MMKLRRDCPVQCQLCGLVEQGAVMEDRELLELAAKAAGLHVDVRSTIPGWLWVRESKTHGPYRLWNPLTDDGDALRLAVRLSIEVQPYRAPGNGDGALGGRGVLLRD